MTKGIGEFHRLGFTLIELMSVVTIIGILLATGFVTYSTVQKKTRDTKRGSDIYQIQQALELYYFDHGQYPPSGGATTPNASWSNSSDNSWNTLQTYLAPYIPMITKDPQEDSNPAMWGGGGHHYSYFSSGYGCNQQWYMLVYDLETAAGTDPGVTTCDSTFFQYGGAGANTTVKTVGRRAM